MTSGSPARIAAIDCGTNSTRLLIIGEHGQGIVRLMRITRLGQGVDATQELDAQAMNRTLAVLAEFRSVMDQQMVTRTRMVATSAVRDARNGREFLDAASAVVGVQAELLSGDEEGELAFAGATADLPSAAGECVVLDIGGGSTELIVPSRNGLSVVSLDLGCVRLTERHFSHDPPTRKEISEARATIGTELGRATRVVPSLGQLRPRSRLIGLAGTVSTLSMLQQHLVEYDWGSVHHSQLTRRAVRYWCTTLAKEPASDRAARPGMLAGREDVIVGGALVLLAVMCRFGFEQCLVSEADILDGLASTIA